MGYSARRGFTNGSMKMTGAQRQAEMQARIQQMQEQVNAAGGCGDAPGPGGIRCK